MEIITSLVGRIGLWLFVIAYKRQSTIVGFENNVPRRFFTILWRTHEVEFFDHGTKGAHNKALCPLVYKLGLAYDNQGIQGVLEACDDEESSLKAAIDTSSAAIEDIVQKVHETFPHHHQRGKVTGVLNGIMGWCCHRSCQTGNETYAKLCDRLYDTYSDQQRWKPDIVTLALAFTGVVDKYPEIARRIMDHVKHLQNSHNNQQVPSIVLCRRKENAVSTHNLEILFDDSDFLVLNKPSGMSLSELERVLLQQGMILSDLNPDGSRGFVHRLDTGTSGCLVMAKSNIMHLKLVSQFFLRQVQKSYIALVFNPDDCVELPCSGIIDLPIGGRPAKSQYSILPTNSQGCVVATLQARATRIRIETQQGRTHQVRIHCSKGLHRPVLLDPLYGGERAMYLVDSNAMKQARSNKQFCLHADQLSLPALGVHVSATIPFWWDQIEKDIINSR